MDILGAYRLFVSHGVDNELIGVDPERLWGASVTAFASLSGRLDECATYDDLRAAVWCANSMFRAGVIDTMDVQREGTAVLREVWSEGL